MNGLEGAFLSKIENYLAPSPSEILAVKRLFSTRRIYSARIEITDSPEKDRGIFVLNKGWGYSFKDLPNGLRQIVDFILPGDFFGLEGIFLDGSGLGFSSITPIEAALISPQSLLAAAKQWPRLGGAILWAASLEGSIAGERLIALGRRSATARVAHLLLELSGRLEFVGQGSATGFFCPLTQHDLADALGLTAIHVNRVLRSLRQLGLVVFRNSEVEFLDRVGLAAVAQFDAGYLGRGRASSLKIFNS